MKEISTHFAAVTYLGEKVGELCWSCLLVLAHLLVVDTQTQPELHTNDRTSSSRSHGGGGYDVEAIRLVDDVGKGDGVGSRMKN